MSTETHHLSISEFISSTVNLIQSAAFRYFDDPFSFATSINVGRSSAQIIYTIPGFGVIEERIAGTFSPVVSMSDTITGIDTFINGQLAHSFSGRMNVSQFVNFDWPAHTVFGNQNDNFIVTWGASTINAGAGNDIVAISGVGSAGRTEIFAGTGNDRFVFEGMFTGHVVLRDFQVGEDLVFADFDNIGQFYSAVTSVGHTANGFFVNINNPWHSGASWTLEFQNVRLEQFNLGDVHALQEAPAVFADLIQMIGNVPNVHLHDLFF